PAGMQMAGTFPILRYIPDPGRGPGGRVGPARDTAAHPEPFTQAEEADVQRWYNNWTAARVRLRAQAEVVRGENSRTDWRPVISYSANLSRMGDWLLDTDSAWVALGRAFERPRAALGPLVNLQAGGRLPP